MGINAAYILGYSNSIIGIINSILVPTLIALAFIVFLWGVYNYFIYGADNDDKRKEGRTFVLYGVIGFVIIFSLWALVNILMGTLGLGPSKSPPPPTIGGSTGASSATPAASPISGAIYRPPASPPSTPGSAGSRAGTPPPQEGCSVTGISNGTNDCRPGYSCVSFQCLVTQEI